MTAFILGMPGAVVAMLAAVVRIRIAKANAYISRKAESDGKHGYGPYDRICRFLQCPQNAHREKVYHNPFREVKRR